MKRTLLALIVLAMASSAWAWKDAWQDDGPKYFHGTDANGNPTTVKQPYPDQNIVVGNDGTPYKVVQGGIINLNTGQFIPR